jgi:hypothetical protein
MSYSSQESRIDSYDNTPHAHRTLTSIPIDSNIGKYKTHSYNQQYQPVARDLISHYYPADSTLNIHTLGKKRSPMTNPTLRSDSRDDTIK